MAPVRSLEYSLVLFRSLKGRDVVVVVEVVVVDGVSVVDVVDDGLERVNQGGRALTGAGRLTPVVAWVVVLVVVVVVVVLMGVVWPPLPVFRTLATGRGKSTERRSEVAVVIVVVVVEGVVVVVLVVGVVVVGGVVEVVVDLVVVSGVVVVGGGVVVVVVVVVGGGVVVVVVVVVVSTVVGDFFVVIVVVVVGGVVVRRRGCLRSLVVRRLSVVSVVGVVVSPVVVMWTGNCESLLSSFFLALLATMESWRRRGPRAGAEAKARR